MTLRTNYATHAIDDIKTIIRSGKASSRDLTPLIHMARDLAAAPKFLLPDRGELIFEDGDIPENTEVFRLPFPVTLVEFPFTVEKVGEGERPSSRRIAIAVEGEIYHGDDGEPFFGPSDDPSGFSVRVISYVDHDKVWSVEAAQGFVKYGTSTITSTQPSRFAKFPSSSATPFTIFPHLPDTYQIVAEHPLGGLDSLSHDIGREVNVITEFLAVISCSNVSTEILTVPKALNVARKTKKKAPFFDYHILVVGPERSQSGSGNASPSDGDPKVRTHLRRGHIRRLDGGSRRIWVNATIVAPGSKLGVAGKDYRVKGSG